jgi:Ca-activated chloride channel family protein
VSIRGSTLRSFRPSSILIFSFLIALASAPPATRAAPPPARQSFATGLQAFSASNYAAAAESFAAAATAAPASKLDPAAAHLNAGIAALAAGDPEAASTHFANAAAGPDLALQAQAYYNRGNSLFQLVDRPSQAQAMPAAAPTTDLDSSKKAIGEAIQMYENAIALDPDDADAKANYELAVLKQQQIQEMQQQQQDQQQQKDDQQDEQQQQPSDQQEQPQDPSDQKEEQEQDQQAQQQPEPGDQQEEEQASAATPESAEEMTPEEAEMLLDTLKAQEQSQRDRLHPFLGRPVPVDKDW